MRFAKHQLFYFSIFTILLISVISHIFFSWIGFNPTDDGFILSLSRRIIDGQFPHRDFIYIRPAFSPVIHVPFVFFGGEYTFWISRLFVWFELSSVSCIWTVIILRKFFSVKFNAVMFLFFSLSCFVFSTYTAFVFAYSTYDALFLYSIGLLLCYGNFKYAKFAGYFIVGLSYLCRQNFLIMVPITLWMLGDLKRVSYWTAAILPGIIYLLLMTAFGAAGDFLMQVFSLSGNFHGGFKVYVTNWGFWVFLLAGYVLIYMTQKNDNINSMGKINFSSLTGWIIYSILPIVSLIFLSREIYPLFISFCLFGFVLGATIFLFLRKQYAQFKHGLFLLFTGWVVSISIGMSYPALLSGEYIIFVIIIFLRLNDETVFSKKSFKFKFNLSNVILFLLVIFGFTYARLTYTYRDKSSGELHYKIEDAIKGTKNIQTNINTYLFLEDLKKAVSLVPGKEYCILPDMAAYWVKSPDENPLSFSWANKTELNYKIFDERVKDEVRNNRGLVVILQKVYANSIQRGETPIKLDNSYNPIIKYIKENFSKFSETYYFELYK